MHKVSATFVIAVTCACCLTTVGCSHSKASVTPAPAPTVVLNEQEKGVWAPLPADRSEIPVLLYHGIAQEHEFANAGDAAYGVAPEDFAKQLTMIAHAGYQTVGLPTFLRFVQGKPVELPPRPLLLTFDDARADSWTGADATLKKLGFDAVMFVDAGRVEDGDPEYLTWKELETMQKSGRWRLELHSGRGHVRIQWGSKPDDVGAFYAYKEQGESFSGWENRAFSDLSGGRQQLARHIPDYEPLAFAPPYGTYGQDGTNDDRIPSTLLGWLEERYRLIFTQDESPFAKAGAAQPIGRIQVTRAMSGGELHTALTSP